MARFGQQFIQGLLQPSYQQGLFGLGSQVGQGPAIKAEREQRQGMLTQIQQALTSGDPSATASAAASLIKTPGFEKLGIELASGSREQKAQQALLDALASGDSAKVKQAISEHGSFAPDLAAKAIGSINKPTRADYFKQNPNEEADLYKNFTAPSVQAFISGTGVLQPIPKEDKTKISEHGQRLVDQGLTPGTPEYSEAMRTYNDSISSGRAKGVTYKGPLEQTKFLTDELRESPLYGSTVALLAKTNLAESLIPAVEAGDSENIRLLERTVSELYNSDTRAASEIDRLLEGRGIKERFQNWIISGLTGDVSKDTKDTLKAIVKSAKNLGDAQKQKSINYIKDAYGSFVDSDVLTNWSKTNLNAFSVDALTEEDAIKLYLGNSDNG